MDLLDDEAVARELTQIPEWRRADNAIVKTVGLADFAAAMTYVNKVAEIAEAHDHHPDITIQWNKVTLTLSTHAAGGLTARDFRLARRIDQI